MIFTKQTLTNVIRTLAVILFFNFTASGDATLPIHKLKTAQTVIDHLVEAYSRVDIAPEFTMTQHEKHVAWTSKRGIGLEEKAYDLCMSYGKDSLNMLAILLGHEMIHFYENHLRGSLKQNYYITNYDRYEDTEKAKIRKIEMAKEEARADELGSFLAHVAGYQVLDLIPDFLQKVYQTYDLNENIPGYPSLQQRKQIAYSSQERAEKLVMAFETANYLTALKKYEEAEIYYNFVLTENGKGGFKSREIFNNAGVCAVLAGLEYYHAVEKQFILPLTIDVNSRLKKGQTPMAGHLGEPYRGFFNKALNYFENAISLDKNYPVALLNKATVLLLQRENADELDDANYFAGKAGKLAKKSGDKTTLTNTNVLKGIIKAIEADTIAAIAYFDKAIADKSIIARFNKLILQDSAYYNPVARKELFRVRDLTPTTTASRLFATHEGIKSETISDINLNSFLQQGKFHENTKFQLNDDIECGKMSLPNESTLYLHYMSAEDYILIQKTSANYKGHTVKGLKIGSKTASLFNKYGSPTSLFATLQGDLFIYEKEDRTLIFLIKDDCIKSWSLVLSSR